VLTLRAYPSRPAATRAGSLWRIDGDDDTELRYPDRVPRPAASPVLAAISMLLAFVLAQVVAIALLAAAGVKIDVDGTFGSSDAMALVAVQCIGVVFAAATIRLGPLTWRSVGAVGTPRRSFDVGWRLLLPVGIVVIGPTFAIAAYGDEPLLAGSVTLTSALAFTLLAIAIAVNEELWFRGLIVDRLEQAHRPWLTVGVASLLFGLPHVAATSASLLNAAAVTLVVGIPFTIVRLRCGSIWPLVAWHALIDLWAFLHTASVVAEGDPSAVEAAGALVLPLVVGVGYLVWFRRDPMRRIRQ
jgi:membrane protease YdiL (CAAX protease family)